MVEKGFGLNVVSFPLNETAVHWVVDGHATACRPPLLSIWFVFVTVPALGLNVTSFPPGSTAVHCVVLPDGHATAFRPPLKSIWVEALMIEKGFGSNVTSFPPGSTAVHWLADEHATPLRPLVPSIVVGVGAPGEVGLNASSCP